MFVMTAVEVVLTVVGVGVATVIVVVVEAVQSCYLSF